MKALPVDKFPLNSKLRSAKADVMSERVFRFFIYTLASLLEFWVLKQGNLLDVRLLGDQENPQYFTNYPCQKLPKYIDDLYIMKFAYHFFELLNASLLHRHRRDFSEFLLHHIITLVLVSSSYYLNLIPIGAAIMLTMDFSDIFVALFKINVDVNEKA